MSFSYIGAVSWMIQKITYEPEEYTCSGEALLTKLAEDFADEWDQKHEGGPLDDETHWIWDAPCEAARLTHSEPGVTVFEENSRC